jgi:uncharacterized protein YxeA
MKRNALLRIIVMLLVIFGSFYILKETYLDCKNISQKIQSTKDNCVPEKISDKKLINHLGPFSRFFISLW